MSSSLRCALASLALGLILAPLALPAKAQSSAQQQANRGDSLPRGEELLTFAQQQPERAAAEIGLAIADARRGPDFPTLDHLALLDGYALALVGIGQLAEAAAVYQELEQLWATRDEITPEELAELRLGLQDARARFGDALLQQERYGEAEQVWSSLAPLARARLEEGDPNGLYPLLQLTNALRLQGRMQEAEGLLRDALELSRRMLGRDNISTIVTLYNLAETVFLSDRREEALPIYRSAFDSAQVTLAADDPLRLQIAIGLATNLSALGRAEEAQPLLEQAYERLGNTLGEDALLTLRTANMLALNLLNLNRHAEALEMLRALEPRILAAVGPDHPDAMNIRQNILVLRRLTSDDPHALVEETRAAFADMRARRQRIAAGATSASGSANLTADEKSLYALMIDAAYQVHLLGKLQGEPEQESAARSVEIFSLMQELAESPASLAIARSTARALAEREGGDILARFAALESLSERYRALREERNALFTGTRTASSLEGDTLQAQATLIEAEMTRIEAEIVTLHEGLARDFPAYAELISAPPMELRDAFSLVEGTQDAIVMILPTFLGTHVFAVDANGFFWARSDLTTQGINAIVRRLLWDVGASVDVSPDEAEAWEAQGQGAYPFDRSSAHRLYRELFGPLEQMLEGKRHLYIAAAGSLASLPLGMLVTQEPQGIDGDPAALRQTRWFADAHALIQVPSLQALQFQRRFAPPKTETGGFVGIGDPLLDGTAQARGGGTRRSRGSGGTAITPSQAFASAERSGPRSPGIALASAEALRRLARLPGTRQELLSLQQVLGNRESLVLTGADATETAVKQADLGRAQIIAFATHGLLAGELDGQSEPGLVLTPPPSPSPTDDGLLTMSEIAALRLNAEWVILSACNTAAGDGSGGAPGLSGIAKSFFLAGAQSLLASHWPVRDDVAARLTVRTIAIATEDPALSRAEALQRAMREIRNDPSADSESDTWAHPNAWAPFTLIGDAR